MRYANQIPKQKSIPPMPKTKPPKVDTNGYGHSLFYTECGVCYLTGISCATVRHEVFNGSNRKLSKQDGLWINVSPEAHELLHKDKRGGKWAELQKEAELLWLTADYDRSINDFIERYGKNYL